MSEVGGIGGESGGGLRVLVVDDERPARDNLRVLLEADPDIREVTEAADGPAAVRAVREEAPDLVFLDIQMPGIDGIEVVRRVGVEEFPPVVFVTAHDRFALEAFEAAALDYLLKPFNDDRFRATLERAKRRVRQRRGEEIVEGLDALLSAERDPGGSASRAGSGVAERPLRRIAVKEAERVRLVDVEDIDWIEAADYYVRLHVGDEQHLIRESLSHLEERLDPDRFLRIHRSTIVNLDRVVELHPWRRGGYRVVLEDGTRLTLSRRRKEHLESVLGQSL